MSLSPCLLFTGDLLPFCDEARSSIISLQNHESINFCSLYITQSLVSCYSNTNKPRCAGLWRTYLDLNKYSISWVLSLSPPPENEPYGTRVLISASVGWGQHQWRWRVQGQRSSWRFIRHSFSDGCFALFYVFCPILPQLAGCTRRSGVSLAKLHVWKLLRALGTQPTPLFHSMSWFLEHRR